MLSRDEVELMNKVFYGNYTTQIEIEANCTVDIIGSDILPAGFNYVSTVSAAIVAGDNNQANKEYLDIIREKLSILNSVHKSLKNALKEASEDPVKKAEYYRDTVIPVMNAARKAVDALEGSVPREKWPLPSYTEMLFSEHKHL